MQDKELDLGDVLKIASQFLKKNALYFLVFAVIGIGIGFYNYTTSNNTYQTDIYAKAEVLPLELISNEVSSINRLVQNNDFPALKKIFQDQIIDSSTIEDIEFSYIYERDKFFLVRIESHGATNYNTQIINDFKGFLSNNEFISVYMNNEFEKIQKLLQSNKSQVELMRKVQDRMINKVTGQDLKSMIIDPGSISSELLKLESEIIDLTNQMDRFGVFNVVDIIHSTQEPSLPKSILSSLLIVLFLGTLLLLGVKFLRL